jgi:uncharacterized membrane-anchored protein
MRDYLKTKRIFNKVADISILFWVIKIISTTVGEASADFFSHQFGFMSFMVTFILLLISIVIQLKFKKYVPWMYWTVIILVAVFGTMFSDRVHHLGVPLIISSFGFIILLLVIFSGWYVSEKTLSVHAIHTTKRELFYWIVIFVTFAFGTATGDLVADTFHFGLMGATLTFGVMMVVIPFFLYVFKTNRMVLFWISYILTRPFGAAGADLLAKPVAHGGFGLGDGTTSIIFLIVIIALVTYLTITSRKEMLIEERLSTN